MALLSFTRTESALLCASFVVIVAWLVHEYTSRLQGDWPKAPGCDAVEKGSTVRLEYKLTRDEDGSLLDSSAVSGEMKFVCGADEIYPTLDAGVVGMRIGEIRSLPFGKEYGSRVEEYVVAVGIDQLQGINLEVGKEFTLPTEDGDRNAMVVAFNDTAATLDFNHPLAGQNTTMTVLLLNCAAPPNVTFLETMALGDGKNFPKPGDRVAVHSVGSFASSGEIFHSSREKGEPFTFQLGAGEVIRGLDLAVGRLSLGQRATVWIPSELSYGEKNEHNSVPYQGDVIFDLELLKIN